MRIVMVALGSFIVGAVSMLLLGNQTSIFAQGSTSGAILRDTPAVPIVPPYRGTLVNNVTLDPGSRFAVDGVLCKACKFGANTTFEYAGGEFRLEDAKIAMPVSIDLKGAALNTAQFLQLFGLLGCPAKQAPPVMGTEPILRARYVPSGILKSAHAN